MVQTLRVADEIHRDVKIAAIKEGVTMEVLTAQWLRVAKVAPRLADAIDTALRAIQHLDYDEAKPLHWDMAYGALELAAIEYRVALQPEAEGESGG